MLPTQRTGKAKKIKIRKDKKKKTIKNKRKRQKTKQNKGWSNNVIVHKCCNCTAAKKPFYGWIVSSIGGQPSKG